MICWTSSPFGKASEYKQLTGAMEAALYDQAHKSSSLKNEAKIFSSPFDIDDVSLISLYL
jgi:hypothetical protein